MRPKLLIAVLVLALSGANSGLRSMCTAYCLSSSSVGSAVAHHDKMESHPGPTSISHHMHAHHKGAEGAERPPRPGHSLSEEAVRASSAELQPLKEPYFALHAPREVSRVQACR